MKMVCLGIKYFEIMYVLEWTYIDLLLGNVFGCYNSNFGINKLFIIWISYGYYFSY